MKSVNKNSLTYQVTYTKRNGQTGAVNVRAISVETALSCAKSSVFTGSQFRDAILVVVKYIKTTKQGFAGCNRM